MTSKFQALPAVSRLCTMVKCVKLWGYSLEKRRFCMASIPIVRDWNSLFFKKIILTGGYHYITCPARPKTHESGFVYGLPFILSTTMKI